MVEQETPNLRALVRYYACSSRARSEPFRTPEIGIEYNGVYHLQAIHGEDRLQKIQAKDALKKRLAKELGIQLLVIEDFASTPNHIQILSKQVLEQLSHLVK